jgi:DNA gyrase subunit A
MRGRHKIEKKTGGKVAIVIEEIPYQVNKAKLVEKIAELVKDKKNRRNY